MIGGTRGPFTQRGRSTHFCLEPNPITALGRRIKKVVSKSGENDKTEVYLYDGQKIIEIRNGSNAMVQQFIHGTQYIDELVMIRVKDKGDLYVHQDANWNVVGLTDLGGRLVERYAYSPYGELIVHQSTGYGDYDGDTTVGTSDRNAISGACAGSNPTGACRILDLNFDNTVNSSDTTPFDALPQGLQRHPGRLATAVSQPFAHQGLLFEPEIGSYQNRARQYDPGKRRFGQRDPLGAMNLSASGYEETSNLYTAVVNNPFALRDPSGLGCRISLLCWPAFGDTGLNQKDPYHCEFRIKRVSNWCGSLSSYSYTTCHGSAQE